MPKAQPGTPDVPETPVPEPIADQPTVDEQVPAPEWTNWVYSGPPGRIYAAVPVTPQPGDVLRWHQSPANDGCWQPTTAPQTRWPDNHRPEPEPDTGDAQQEG